MNMADDLNTALMFSALIYMMPDLNGLHCSIYIFVLFFFRKKWNLIIALPYRNVGFMLINRAASHPYDQLYALCSLSKLHAILYPTMQCSRLDHPL